MQVKINYKENIKRKDLEAILIAESTAAKKGDAKSVVLLSKLIQKRLKNINYLDLVECDNCCENPPERS